MLHQHAFRKIEMQPIPTTTAVTISWSTPVWNTQQAFESPIQSSREWHAQKKAARDAGMNTPSSLARDISLAECATCGIHIGPDHMEQEMYLYPVVQQRVRFSDDSLLYVEHGWFEICGSCARRRGLDARLRFISPQLWQTTILLNNRLDAIPPERQKEAFVAIRSYINALCMWVFFINVLQCHISIPVVFAQFPEELHTPILAPKKSPYPVSSSVLLQPSMVQQIARSTQPLPELQPVSQKTGRFAISKMGINVKWNKLITTALKPVLVQVVS